MAKMEIPSEPIINNIVVSDILILDFCSVKSTTVVNNNRTLELSMVICDLVGVRRGRPFEELCQERANTEPISGQEGARAA